MSAPDGADTPPVERAERRRTLVVRVALVVAVLLAGGIGLVSTVGAATPPFSIDEPTAGQAVTAGKPVRASGVPGDAALGSLWVLASQPGPRGTVLYTVGERARFVHGRFEGTVPAPSVRGGASVVIVRADPSCGTQLDAFDAPDQGAGRFYGPLPAGCTAVATVPVQVSG